MSGDRSNDPLAAISYGRDFNYFKTVTPGSSGSGVFATDADAIITFSTYTVTFNCYGGTVQYSFNGNTIHGTMDSTGTTAPSSLTFTNRVISKIWFSTISSSPTIRVEAWSIR